MGSGVDFEALFKANWPQAYRAAYFVVHDTAAAEDIAQEAFIAAARSLDRFDWRRPFAPWLHRIVVNRAIDWARARSLRKEIGGDALQSVDRAVDLEQPGTDNPFGELREALAELTPEQRAVIVLRYLLEYTPGEISRMLELPRGTVNSRLRRGLDQMRATLEEDR
jgi:RNA polymerase sigma-70 factor, ECF subfamily